MKLQSALSAALFVVIAALSVGAQAADAEKAQAGTEVKSEQGAKAAKPHSHMEEKTGVPQSAPNAPAGKKKNAAKDKAKHYHPRDGK